MFAKHWMELFMKHVLPKFDRPAALLVSRHCGPLVLGRPGSSAPVHASAAGLLLQSRGHTPPGRCSSSRITWPSMMRQASSVSSSLPSRLSCCSSSGWCHSRTARSPPQPSSSHKRFLSIPTVDTRETSMCLKFRRSANVQALSPNWQSSTRTPPPGSRMACRATGGPPPYRPWSNAHVSAGRSSKSKCSKIPCRSLSGTSASRRRWLSMGCGRSLVQSLAPASASEPWRHRMEGDEGWLMQRRDSSSAPKGITLPSSGSLPSLFICAGSMRLASVLKPRARPRTLTSAAARPPMALWSLRPRALTLGWPTH
mmetsp:Transcript_125406/g.354734  ORF Transcript_125406/g.354734 Transcript_125406/m.354734 type:complete len:312 (-) Transcript_125406:315-1250(-)